MGHGREALILVKPLGKAFEAKWTVGGLNTEDEESVRRQGEGICAHTECLVLWMQREQRLLENREGGEAYTTGWASSQQQQSISRGLPKKTSWNNS